jgi:hypothetical protein
MNFSTTNIIHQMEYATMSDRTRHVFEFADPSIEKEPLTKLIRLGAQHLLEPSL